MGVAALAGRDPEMDSIGPKFFANRIDRLGAQESSSMIFSFSPIHPIGKGQGLHHRRCRAGFFSAWDLDIPANKGWLT